MSWGVYITRLGTTKTKWKFTINSLRSIRSTRRRFVLGKDASARASMKRGGWTQAETYRDLIKDKDEAISLEQQSRIRLTGEALEQQITETYARHQAEPENLNFARRLGALSEQRDDFESAIRWYQYAVGLGKGADTGLL